MPSLSRFSGNVALITGVIVLGLSGLVSAQDKGATPTAQQAQFFKEKVKPLLEANCLKCHGAAPKVKGGLFINSRAGILKGGDSGPAVSLKQADKSLLLIAISHADEDLQMPPKKKLGKEEAGILTQ